MNIKQIRESGLRCYEHNQKPTLEIIKIGWHLLPSASFLAPLPY